MKTLFYSLAFFLIATLASAQAITQERLQGAWKICAFNVNGINWDFKTDVVTLPAEYEASTLGPSQKEAMIADIRAGLADYKDGSFVIKGNYVEQSMAGQTASGTFSLQEQNKKWYINIVNDDAAKTTETLMVALKDGKMQLTIPDGMGGITILTYCK
ncbi:hypothetical protein OGH69_08680 [Flavobacterium sp. MFBS3-15]|uniref:hypothetical protein n=1 Tax=Flavobacterium sp. MFBS3-15 TaxID=2989816 RepID=UPI00223673A4|nr:hypothetical protein [Flavobacterium sp. MFBS3-15]MCW4469036.1 hypothetical protein [Flavobacterium sp. MFBS3-15]